MIARMKKRSNNTRKLNTENSDKRAYKAQKTKWKSWKGCLFKVLSAITEKSNQGTCELRINCFQLRSLKSIAFLRHSITKAVSL